MNLQMLRTALMLGTILLTGCATSGSTITLQPREKTTQQYLWTPVEKARATVVLFAGGGGNIRLSSGGSINSSNNNFLVRSRDFFSAHQFNVAIFDAPSDRKGRRGMRGGFRHTAEHATDILAVINDVTSKSSVPVWLVGTSRGTESAATGAIDHGEHIHGFGAHGQYH